MLVDDVLLLVLVVLEVEELDDVLLDVLELVGLDDVLLEVELLVLVDELDEVVVVVNSPATRLPA